MVVQILCTAFARKKSGVDVWRNERTYMAKKIEHIFKNGVEMKICTKCNNLLPLSNFRKDKTKSDGYYSSCKICSSKKDHNTYIKNPKKKYEKVLEYQIKTGLIKKYKPYNPKYYSSDESKRKKRARDLNRRLLKRNADAKSKITSDIIARIIKKYDGKCAYCGKNCIKKYHIDHKIPLPKGGGNEFENLALSCPKCNLSKNDKTDVEYIGYKV